MTPSTSPASRPEIVYPESDGKPIADNTKQFRWIATVKEGLDDLFRDRDDVFVAGDLLWYPVEGDNRTRTAPDVLVAFGRPKGDRGCYKQWEEGGIAPQVVFEILSPGNRKAEMARKLRFYDRFGVEEYYLYDPDHNTLEGWLRGPAGLRPIPSMDGWTSPRLGIRFELLADDLTIWRPDGRPFLTYLELSRQRDAERRLAEDLARQRDAERALAEDLARQRDAERRLAEDLARQRDAERRRAERLAARLRELGLDPDSPPTG